MEENKNFSWTNLFVKVILAIIFILFAVWLLSLSNKGLSDSLNVLTDDIFNENIDRMKEVGKEYFTIERLPQKVGEIETLTLKEMYEKELILEVKDKNGNACDAEDSYVSIEKFDNEYQMKVNLECDDREEYIIVIMGCYDYCDTDICEVEVKDDSSSNKEIEYEYKKTTGGKWTDYGSWSEWSKVSVTNTDYRQVETKKVNEEYTYEKVVTSNSYKDPVCPTLSGYTLIGRNGFTCKYSKSVTSNITKTASCPVGYTKSGNTCVDSSPATKDPVCPSKSGWTYTGRNSFTCNYKKTVTSSDYTLQYVTTKTGSYVPADTSTYHYEQIDADYIYDCDNECAFVWVYTYKVYKKVYGTTTETTTASASCPSGYTKSGNTCVEKTPATKDPVCPTVSGYTYEGRNGFTCNYSKQGTEITTKTASCPVGYNETSDKTRCYKTISHTVTETGTREVTYYRYRVREYIGGSVDYKWSKSKNDKKLLDAGYKLTGRTR